MINTPEFESLERLMRLDRALKFTHQFNETLAADYEWMRAYIVRAMIREQEFAINNKLKWQEKYHGDK